MTDELEKIKKYYLKPYGMFCLNDIADKFLREYGLNTSLLDNKTNLELFLTLGCKTANKQKRTGYGKGDYYSHMFYKFMDVMNYKEAFKMYGKNIDKFMNSIQGLSRAKIIEFHPSGEILDSKGKGISLTLNAYHAFKKSVELIESREAGK